MSQPTPLDPAVKNAWGTILNTDFSLIDAAVAGLLGLDCSAGGTIVLTSTPGAADQARNALFNLTGALASDTTILWPQNVTGEFQVTNNTTVAHSVTLGVNNGSGSPAGTTIVIGQGSVAGFKTDGTNIVHTSGFLVGTFAPADTSSPGPGPVLTSALGYFRKTPGMCSVWGSVSYPANSNVNGAKFSIGPYASANLTTHVGGFIGAVQFGGGGGMPGGALPNWAIVLSNTANMEFRVAGGTSITNQDLSTTSVDFSATYPTAT